MFCNSEGKSISYFLRLYGIWKYIVGNFRNVILTTYYIVVKFNQS